MALPPEDPPAGVPDWILTYGDMMSLLLCFFILLASMSEMKKDEKTQAIVESIMEQFADPEQLEAFRANSMKAGMVPSAVKQKDPTNRKRRGGRQGLPGNKRRVETVREGLRHTIGGPVLFESGEATLTDDAKESIQSIAQAMQGKRHMIEVRGYENLGELPPTSKFKDRIDLAYARARAVVEYLASDCGIRRDLIRMSVAAPIESTHLPRLQSGETMHDRVTISATEATRRDFDGSGLPIMN
ncbi:MAG: flagellar motor protein MotB [Planctomycetota bacterium]